MLDMRIGQALQNADASPTDLLLQAAQTFGAAASWTSAHLGLSAADVKLCVGVIVPLALYLRWTSSAGPPPGPPPPGWDV